MAVLNQSGFTRDTLPNLFNRPSFGTEYRAAHQSIVPPTKDVYPAKDVRYPAFAGKMSDGRLVTDYRSQCSKNVKPAYQFNTKLWMINHAEDIIEESRRRQVEWSGASFAMANTVPPPADIVYSTPFYSEVNATNLEGGIGVVRSDSKAPMIFGTFVYEPTMAEIQNNRKNIRTTTHYEGGRNSIRGTF